MNLTHNELLSTIDYLQVEGTWDISQDSPRFDLVAKNYRALREVVELHKPMTGRNYRSDTPQCSYCRSLCHSNSGLNCEDDGDGLWPCDTILKIEKELSNG